MIVSKTHTNKGKEFFSRFTKFGWAALALTLVFLLVGAGTIGGFTSSGKGYRGAADSSVVFYLDYDYTQADGTAYTAELDSIYVNVGAVYAEPGSDVALNFRRATTSGPYKNNKFTSFGLGNFTVGNIWSESGSGVSGANYNWLKAFDISGSTTTWSTSYRLIRITFPCDMVVNEVVFVDTNGNVIPAYVRADEVLPVFSNTPDWATYRDLFSTDERRPDAVNLLDSQNNVRVGKTAYTNFTQDEIYTLMQISSIRMGDFTTDGVFTADTENGPLAVLFPLLGTLLFGNSPFGLRIFSVLFTAALVALAYFFGKELFGSGGFGFLLACLVAGGGLALTVGRLGLSLPVIAFFAALSFFFMYRFFSEGMDAEHPARSALNVLLSGLMFALAFAADPKCVFLLFGLVALFVVGAVRYAKAYAAEKAALRREMSDKNAAERSEEVMQQNIDECEEQTAYLRSDYVYGSKLIYLFFFVSFIVGTVLFTVLAMLPSYYTYVRLYDADPSSPSAGLFSLLFSALGSAFTSANVTQLSAANASSAFGWLIGLKGATLFSASGEGTYIALNAQPNLAVIVTAAIGFVFTTAYAVPLRRNGQTAGRLRFRIFFGHPARLLPHHGGNGLLAAAIRLHAGERGGRAAVRFLLVLLCAAHVLHGVCARRQQKERRLRHPHERHRHRSARRLRAVPRAVRAVRAHVLRYPAVAGRGIRDVRLDDLLKQRLLPHPRGRGRRHRFGRAACGGQAAPHLNEYDSARVPCAEFFDRKRG